MNYEQKVLSQQGGYKGFLLLNGEVVAATNICQTLIEATNRLRSLMKDKPTATSPKIASRPNYPIPNLRNNTISSLTYNPPPPSSIIPRKCCGRG